MLFLFDYWFLWSLNWRVYQGFVYRLVGCVSFICLFCVVEVTECLLRLRDNYLFVLLTTSFTHLLFGRVGSVVCLYFG